MTWHLGRDGQAHCFNGERFLCLFSCDRSRELGPHDLGVIQLCEGCRAWIADNRVAPVATPVEECTCPSCFGSSIARAHRERRVDEELEPVNGNGKGAAE